MEPAFVLVRPQMPENIGGAARAMWNFGLSQMRVVAPRDGWPAPKAVAVASGAGRLLDNAGHFDTVPEAVADCTRVYATTARTRDMTKRVVTPEEAMTEMRELSARGERTAVLFGPERAGLENADVVLANAVVTVPVNPQFYSLNLAQCVLLLAYEWMRQGASSAPTDMGSSDVATQVEVEALARHFEQRLDDAGFFHPTEKAPSMKLNLRNLWSRMPLTRGDTATLHGALRQLVRGRDVAGSGGGE